MEGIYFYWFSWIGWVIYTFLMKKTQQRTMISAFLLLMIIGSIHYITVNEVKISSSFLILITVCFHFIAREPKKRTVLFILIQSFIITTAYVSFHMYALFDPVWLVFNQKLMLGLMVVFITLFLVGNHLHRLIIAAVGMAQGEILLALVLGSNRFPVHIGLSDFLDKLAIVTLCIYIWNTIEYMTQSLEMTVQRKQRKAGIH